MAIILQFCRAKLQEFGFWALAARLLPDQQGRLVGRRFVDDPQGPFRHSHRALPLGRYGSPGQLRASSPGRPPPAPQRDGALHQRLDHRNPPGLGGVLAAISACWSDGADEAALDRASAGPVHRCEQPGRLGVPARHAAVEGVLGRPSGRDALDRAPRRRVVAVRGLCVERRRHTLSSPRRDRRRRCRQRRHARPATSSLPNTTVARVTKARRCPCSAFPRFSSRRDRDPLASACGDAEAEHGRSPRARWRGLVRNLPQRLLDR